MKLQITGGDIGTISIIQEINDVPRIFIKHSKYKASENGIGAYDYWNNTCSSVIGTENDNE